MSYRIIKLIIYLTKHIIIILYTNNKKKTYQTIFLFLFNRSIVNFLTINLLIFVKGKITTLILYPGYQISLITPLFFFVFKNKNHII
jgi:hypothetical protein